MKIAYFVLLVVLSLAPGIGVAEAEKEVRKDGPVARLEIEPATVGKPTRIRWSLADPTTGKSIASRLSLTITHLEKGIGVFSLTKILTEGHFSVSFHFTDGAAYRVRSVVEIDGRSPIVEERVISVTAVEPPSKAIVPTLIFFLTVIALGLMAGRISRRWVKG